jgi:hypothetical protein
MAGGTCADSLNGGPGDDDVAGADSIYGAGGEDLVTDGRTAAAPRTPSTAGGAPDLMGPRNVPAGETRSPAGAGATGRSPTART